jgi:hypothetical protein
MEPERLKDTLGRGESLLEKLGIRSLPDPVKEPLILQFLLGLLLEHSPRLFHLLELVLEHFMQSFYQKLKKGAGIYGLSFEIIVRAGHLRL